MFDELKQYCCEKGMVDLVLAIDNVQDRMEKRTVVVYSSAMQITIEFFLHKTNAGCKLIDTKK